MTDQKEVMLVIAMGMTKVMSFTIIRCRTSSAFSEEITDRCLHTALLEKRHNEGITANQTNDFVQH